MSRRRRGGLRSRNRVRPGRQATGSTRHQRIRALIVRTPSRVSVGRYAMKGAARPQELFMLDPAHALAEPGS